MASDGGKGFFGGLVDRIASASRVVTDLTAAVSGASTITNTPYTVQEVTGKVAIEDVSRSHVRRRDEFSIVILRERDESGTYTGPSRQWNIILHHPVSHRMWYLLRSDDQLEATATFNRYSKCIGVLVKTEPTAMSDTTSLQKICDKLREPYSEGWTPAHLAVCLNYAKALNTDLMKQYLNAQPEPTRMTPLHVALEAKAVESVNELLNVNADLHARDLLGNNVVHFAGKSSPEALKLVIAKLPKSMLPLLDQYNGEGLTPLGIACKLNLPQNVEILLGAGCDPLKRTLHHGYPFAIALKNDFPLAIMEALLSNSYDQINLQDEVDGNAALHQAIGLEALQLILDRGGDPNLRNKKGETPLHLHARRSNLKGCLALLCHGAFPDMKDELGNTPLHVAAGICSATIVQVLIGFDADLDLKNEQGFSARHLVATSKRSNKDQVLFILDSCGAVCCPESLKGKCAEGCRFNDVYKGVPPETYIGVSDLSMVHQALEAFSSSREVLSRSRRSSVSNSQKEESGGKEKNCAIGSAMRDNFSGHVGGRLLCLDGGGIRGLVLTQILIYIQKIFGVPVVEVFDWVSGTSTGGILALCLAIGKSPIEIQALYLRLKDKVFTGGRPYSSEKMEEFLKQEFGAETKMSMLTRPRVMVSTAIANQRPADFHFFRNYLSPSVILGESDSCTRGPEDLFIWEVAKATGAAPSYFKLDTKYIDGGLVANNPTLDALTELTQFGAAMRAVGESSEIDSKFPSVVVSLGTGVQPRVQASFVHYDIARPEGVWDAIVKVPKIANIIALLVEQATQTEGQVVERSRAWCAALGVPFFRFSPNLSQMVDLDEVNEEVLVKIMWETRAYLYAHHQEILHLKTILFVHGPLPLEVNIQ